MIAFDRKYPLVKLIVLNVLVVLAYDAARPRPAEAAEQQPALVRAVSEEAPWHVADADRDIGPGEAEPVLCQHGD